MNNFNAMKCDCVKEELEINKDYGALLGLDKQKGEYLFYEGEDKWSAVYVKKEIRVDPNITKRILKRLEDE